LMRKETRREKRENKRLRAEIESRSENEFGQLELAVLFRGTKYYPVGVGKEARGRIRVTQVLESEPGGPLGINGAFR
jgi:hypothetical protein